MARSTIQGNYTQTAAGILLVQIGGPNQYGRLAISGNAAPAGTLELSLLGDYILDAGTSFQILIFAEYTGGFATEVGLRLPHNRSLKPVWNSNGLTLTASK